MRPRSLYARLILGVAIWTIGLLVAVVAIGLLVVRQRLASPMFVHNSMLVLFGAVLVTAGLSVIRRGLSPFRLLRERLAAMREGRTTRLEGEYPTEVEPLVRDLNLLLDERERRVARAVARAGDLAHGLKTPLAILAQDVDRADAAGQTALAESLRRQVERMRRQIDSHLAQARVAASGSSFHARTQVADCVRGLARTMERLHHDRALALAIDLPDTLAVRVPLEDLEEMLGNLLDNACKWAVREVRVSAAAATIAASRIGRDRRDGTPHNSAAHDPADRDAAAGGAAAGDSAARHMAPHAAAADDASQAAIALIVDDDGPGLEASMREQVLRRGVRADEAAPGSGLGLAIVRDLAELYGGTIALDRSPAGGVRARLTLPAATDTPTRSRL